MICLDEYKWERIVMYGFHPSERWGSVMAEYNNRIIVFGGVSFKKYCRPATYVLETGA
jgi:hypothetical protein